MTAGSVAVPMRICLRFNATIPEAEVTEVPPPFHGRLL